MPTPANGTISFANVSAITKGNTSVVSLNDSDVRFLFGVSSGTISLAQGYGKPAPGSNSYTLPGSYTFYTPAYQYIIVDVRGAGGGGGGGCDHWYGLYRYNGNPGGNGNQSSFLGVVGGGGNGGGGGGTAPGDAPGPNGAAGVGSNGDINYTGGGGAGGAQNNGGGPSAIAGGAGGAGGRATKTFTHNQTVGNPNYGTNYTIVVGARGAAGSGTSPLGNYSGSPGSNGAVYVSWS